MDIAAALEALESLSSSTSTSSSGPLHALIDTHFARAKERILSGDDPRTVILDLQKQVQKSKKEVEKGLKGWYGALGNVGKAVDKTFPPTLGVISKAYENPNLFVDEEAAVALDKAVLYSLGRRGLWDAVAALEKETSLKFPEEQRSLAIELQSLTSSILASNLSPALEWCATNQQYLASPPHPSSLPYYLHRAVFQSIDDKKEAIVYARQHMMEYLPTKPVMKLITSRLYDQPATGSEDMQMAHSRGGLKGANPLSDEDATDLPALVELLRLEFHRLHQWPKEDPLSVAVDIGSTGGALMVIEKARRVMGEHLGHVRQWTDLPMEVPLSASRRYHSVFVCPVSKEQATESNPPKMMTCGHVVASESFDRLLKGGRRDVKCPYCPMETAQSAAQRLYF